jgi:hypothetical protein
MSSAFITDNYSFQSSDSKFILDSCDFPHGAQLDHIICLRSSGLVTKNRFETAPVGIFVQDAGQVIVTHNVFQNCSFGLQFFDGPAGNTNALIYHNTFTDCGVSITLQDDNYPARIRGEIQNNIVVGSTSFAFRIGQNLNTDSVVLSNNCFWANAALTQEAQPRWIELGVLSQINLNGDSTDTYSNIYLTPEFSDTLLHLAEGSPCIDAGREVSLPFNGDAPDIGYWESNYGLAQQAIIGNLPQSHAWSIYPNPTNASVMIDLEALGTCKKVGLYNLLGQLVQKIDQTQILSRRVWLDLSSSKLSTGVYLVKVEGDTNEMVQKLIVLK